MEVSIQIAQYLGTLFVVFGFFVFLRREVLIKKMGEFCKDPFFIYVLAFFEFALGLSVASVHSVWTFGCPVIITLFGWGAMIEGLLYLFLPTHWVQKGLNFVNRDKAYMIGGVSMIVLGLFLLGNSFSLFFF